MIGSRNMSHPNIAFWIIVFIIMRKHLVILSLSPCVAVLPSLGVLKGFHLCCILIIRVNMDDNNMDNLKNTMNTLNSCLNEYVKEHDGFDNLLSNLMINSPYSEIKGLINNLKIKQSTDMFQAKVLHLNILIDTLQTNRIHLDYILLCEAFLHNGNEHLFNKSGYNLISNNCTNETREGIAIHVI